MKRINKENINTRDYLDTFYASQEWKSAVEKGQSHLEMDIALIHDPGPEVLDVGCANGLFSTMYLEKFPKTHMVGVDLSPIVVQEARESCPKGEFHVGSIYSLPFPNTWFDLVHCAELLEHLEHPQDALNELVRVLKKGGTMIITTPNGSAGEYIEHLWMWTVGDVQDMMEKAGVSVKEIIPDFFNGHLMRITGET